MLLYASDWEDAAAAKRYFGVYRTLLGKKWKHLEIQAETETSVTGRGDDGYFLLQARGHCRRAQHRRRGKRYRTGALD